MEFQNCEKPWKTLYDRNCESISMAKERAARLEVKMEPLYQSARNLKEYVRLVGRLCRILYEMNQLQELRISTANLLQQLNILLHPLNNYMMSAKECQYNQKELALQVEEYLQMGVGALEILQGMCATSICRHYRRQIMTCRRMSVWKKFCWRTATFLRPFMEKDR